ncbi:hypothetical protein [Streptomyces sp. WAC 01325]|uniref:hypothetical protein n=1 Tax=Streptomyces sp. WAC 01325 TaxID=2203202 RepID=UPI000F87D424|nr:hypothetical protein [Streptomyces sp. WAC 01325]
MSVQFLNVYERRARLVPGVLAIVPVIVLFAALGLRQIPVVSYVLGLLAVAGVGPVLIVGAVRNFGKAVEQRLWESWGGPPTTVWLRLNAPTKSAAQRESWRKAVEAVSGISLLSLEVERQDAAGADDAIERATERVRKKTRDNEKFELLFFENRHYGYERNIYGIRWAARSISLLSLLALATYTLWVAPLVDRPQVSAANVVGLALCLGCLFGWFILPSKKRVKDAADRYANELLHAAVTLQEEAEAPDRNASAAP